MAEQPLKLLSLSTVVFTLILLTTSILWIVSGNWQTTEPGMIEAPYFSLLGISVGVTFIAGLLTLLHSFVYPQLLLLLRFFGVTLLGAAFIDGVEILLLINDPNADNLAAFCWFLGRSYYALALLLAFKLLFEQNASARRALSNVGALLALSIGLLLAFKLIGGAVVHPNRFLVRPLELIPLALYGFVAIRCIPRVFKQPPSYFAAFLMLSTIPALLGQAHMAISCHSMCDNHFYAAYLFRLVTYITPLYGLFLDFNLLQRRNTQAIQTLDRTSQNLLQRSSELEKKKRRLEAEVEVRLAHEKQLKTQIEFDSLASELANSFLQLEYKETDTAIMGGLERIAKFTNADEVCILLSEEAGPVSLQYEWIRTSETSLGRLLDKADAKNFSWSQNQIEQRQFIRVNALDELPSEADAERQFMKQAGVTKLMAVPLRSARHKFGLLVIASKDNTSPWNDYHFRLLLMTSKIFGNTLTRVQAQLDVLEQQRFLRQIINTSPSLIFAKDREGRFTLVNQAVAKVYGTSVETLLGKTDADFNPNKDEIEHFRNIDNQVIENGQEIITPEERITDAEGRVRWLQTTKRPLEVHSTGERQVLGVSTDITARKNIESVLQEKIRFEKIVRSLSASFINLPFQQIESRITRALEQLSQFMGVDSCSLYLHSTAEDCYRLEESWSRRQESISVLPKQLEQTSTPWLKRQIDSGNVVSCGNIEKLPEFAKREQELLRTAMHSAFACIPITSHSHTIGCLFIAKEEPQIVLTQEDTSRLKLIADILINASQRRRAEEQIKQQAALLDITQDAIIVADLSGHITFWNHAAERLYGWSRDEVLGRDFRPILFRDTKRIPQDLNSALTGLSEWRTEQEHRTREGYSVVVETRWNVIRDKTDKPHSLLIVNTDISERRRWDEELLRSTKLESLGILAGGIAHDFNNILTGILGNSSLGLIETKSESDAHSKFRNIEIAAKRARELTRQLLTFAKGGAPVKKVHSLQAIVNESIDLMLHGSNCIVEFEVQNNLPAVEIDAGQISQVIHNLLINALQAMPDGGTIGVRLSSYRGIPQEKAGIEDFPFKDYVKLEIEDSGKGISRENMTRIFDPYFSTKEEGSGLGLATSYSIVRKHGGVITVDSTVNIGTTFTLYFPASSAKLRPQTEKEGEQTLPGGRVLIMDDDELVQEILSNMLTHLGFEVSIAADGREALQRFKRAKQANTPFLFIIMDITIPGGMGGKETIKRLRRINKEIPVLASSGYSNDPIMSQFKRYGFNGAIEKPYELGALRHILEKLLLKKGEIIAPAPWATPPKAEPVDPLLSK